MAAEARTAVGIVGNVISFGLYLSPMLTLNILIPTFLRILKDKSVYEFKPDPYITMVLGTMLWIFYGLPFVHPDYILVVTISSIGMGMELSYLAIYFIYAPWKDRVIVIIGLLLELAFMGVVAVVTLTKFHTHNSRSNFVGIFFIVVGFINYASPLTIMKQVIKTKSVEYMPFLLSLANFMNGIIWLAYALLKFDLFMTIVTGMGTVSGTLQLILYAWYYKSTPTTNSPDADADAA